MKQKQTKNVLEQLEELKTALKESGIKPVGSLFPPGIGCCFVIPTEFESIFKMAQNGELSKEEALTRMKMAQEVADHKSRISLWDEYCQKNAGPHPKNCFCSKHFESRQDDQ